ncbi:MAG: hypothetical protein H6Q90_1556 [Deltaproteobacteria bacterium]|nr:hypothetical protein [Deltaproteobacteria bacterium]
MKKLIAFPLLALLSLFVVGVASCKQGEGDRCQVAADCTDGLICNQATQTCAKTTGGGIDATVPDAPIVIDAPTVIDAPPDAP